MRGEGDQQLVAGIDPMQAQFWASIGGRPLTAVDTEPYGVEFVTDPERLTNLCRRYPCPTAIDVGHGVFGIRAGRLFIDDDTGRAIAYAPPALGSRRRQS